MVLGRGVFPLENAGSAESVEWWKTKRPKRERENNKREKKEKEKNHTKKRDRKQTSREKRTKEKEKKEKKLEGEILDGGPGSRVALGGEWLGGLLWKERRREGCIDCVRLVRRRADPTSCWMAREWGETRKGYKAAKRARERERKREQRRGGVSYRCEREGEEKT